MKNIKITAFDDREALVSAAFAYTLGALQDALGANQNAVLLGAGGSTPRPLYQQLSQADINWANVTIGLTDERWVPLTSQASNEAMIRQALIQNKAASAKLLSMVTDSARPAHQEISSVNATYAQAVDNCAVMILGMGPDAHTLSWFPDADGLEAALDPANPGAVAAISAKQSPVTGQHTERMTLTLSAVAKARRVLLLITGNEKRDVLEAAGEDSPVGHMIGASEDRLSIYWAP